MTSIWSESFVLNIPVIDQQHKKFFELFEKVSEVYEKKEPEELDKVLRELEDYLEYHFQSEEQLMKEYGYEKYENHKKQHEFFIKRIEEMRREYDYMNHMLFDKIRTFIKKWFVSHILHKDFDYKDALLGRSNQER
ncbi:MAG: bacteriohemerythrin [Bacteroidales bacterium]|nr:hemerythrin family protein [Bacteroidales bacterium]MBS3775982.1 hemerythrin family protein [Bacteroidales bacterium]